MKVLLVNGSSHRNGGTVHSLKIVEAALNESGVDTEWFQLGARPVRGCIDCRKCAETFRCTFNDDVCNALIEAMIASDGVIIGTPVYFASANGALTAVLDRVFYAASTHGRLFTGKPAAAVASFYRSGGNNAVDRISKYFAFSGMPIVTSSYWNLMFAPESFVPNDEMGRMTMVQLGKNMAEMLKKLRQDAWRHPC
ncbi:MAG: flavodoxin family protein [Desulfovibrionaceae bacterium]|nr:flavodoxin family protein [Desulfovibrionaceae bacterium]